MNAIISRWDERYFVVMRPFRPAGSVHIIQQGFVTDLASIPRILWIIWPPFGNYLEAAVLHDYLYSKGLNKQCADKTFLFVMEIYGVGWITRNLFYLAVKIFGNPEKSIQEFKRRGLVQIAGDWK